MRSQLLSSRPIRTLHLSQYRPCYKVISSPAFRKMGTTAKPQPSFSTNGDPVQLQQQLDELLPEHGGRWALTAAGNGVERSFKFKTFKKTWEFMNTVAAQCTVKKHHPEWSNVYNTAFIRWTTHSPPGLSELDISMAKYCDEQALVHGEVESKESSVDKDLADRVAVEGGDCCVPKKKTS